MLSTDGQKHNWMDWWMDRQGEYNISLPTSLDGYNKPPIEFSLWFNLIKLLVMSTKLNPIQLIPYIHLTLLVMSEWVIKSLSPFFSEDIGVHYIVHISHVIITHTLESISFLTYIIHYLQVTIKVSGNSSGWSTTFCIIYYHKSHTFKDIAFKFSAVLGKSISFYFVETIGHLSCNRKNKIFTKNMKETQMPPVHATNLAAKSGYRAYRVDSILNKLSSMKRIEFWTKFHWNVFSRAQLTWSQHLFRKSLGTNLSLSHCMNQWWTKPNHRCKTVSLSLTFPLQNCFENVVCKLLDILLRPPCGSH